MRVGVSLWRGSMVLRCGYRAAPKYTMQMVSIHQADQALKLWQELFNCQGFDGIIETDEGDRSCYFCWAFQPSFDEVVHEDNCIYVRAKALVDNLVTL